MRAFLLFLHNTLEWDAFLLAPLPHLGSFVLGLPLFDFDPRGTLSRF